MSFNDHAYWWVKSMIKTKKKWLPMTLLSSWAHSWHTRSWARWASAPGSKGRALSARCFARGQRHHWRRSAADMKERLSLRPAPRPDLFVTSKLRHLRIPRLARPGPLALRALTCLRYIGADRSDGAPAPWRPGRGEISFDLICFIGPKLYVIR